MSVKKYKIVLIEPSQMVAIGLKSMIETNPQFSVIASLTDIVKYNEFQHGTADIIILNPMVVKNTTSNLQSVVPARGNAVYIAITYGPYNESELHQYDGFIGIYNSAAQICKRLQAALDSVSEKPKQDNGNELSIREQEILTAVAKGKSNKEIADEFNLSIHTVITHRKNISHKLGINSISGLTIYAIINKLIDVTEF